MRTTLTLDDKIYPLIRRYADGRRIPLGEAVSELVRRGFASQRPTKNVNGLVVFDLPPDSPPVSGKKICQIQDDEA